LDDSKDYTIQMFTKEGIKTCCVIGFCLSVQ
jgi:hypothetical protein